MKPIAILQHDPLQGPGYLLDFLNQQRIPSCILRPCEGDGVPGSARAFSGIVVLGSDESVNDSTRWVRQELRLASEAIEHDVPLLGHCFGGQLIAKAMGAAVKRHPCPSIGWSQLRLTPVGRDIFGRAKPLLAFNWHYETFGIPPGAQRTLFGDHCLNKGFTQGKHMAFQCHLEVTEDAVRSWCSAHRDELQCAAGPDVQTEAAILSDLDEQVAELHRAARAAYAAWLAPLRQPRLSLFAPRHCG